MKEMRVKGEYVHHQKIKGAMGIKIAAPGMEHAMAGGNLFRCANQDDIDKAK
jgi:translation initiation factor 5B